VSDTIRPKAGRDLMRACRPWRAGYGAADANPDGRADDGQRQNHPPSTAAVPPEIQTTLVHATLDKQYRALLGQPVPMLGNLTPRAAARTKSGREKLVVWLKHLENRSRQRPEATDPMTSPGCGRS
jgi:hypothetical protein